MKVKKRELLIENAKLKEQLAEIQSELCHVQKDYIFLVKKYNEVIHEKHDMSAKIKKLELINKRIN